MIAKNRLGQALGGLVLAGSIVGLAGCDAPADPAVVQGPPRPVLAQPVVYKDAQAQHALVAVVRPRIEADLGFRVAGRVVRRLADVGAVVRTGDVLAVLDDADLRLQVEQADAEVQAATSNLKTAEAQEKRSTDLTNRGWAAASSYDQQRTVADEARSRLARATRALTLAQNALSYAQITADADGIVTAVLVEPGQVVGAGQVAMRVSHTREIEAQVAIPESQVRLVRAGTARLALWATPDKSYIVHLRELSPAADTASRTFSARFSVENAGADVQIGMTGTLVLTAPGNERVARLPLSALFNTGDGPTVWVADSSTGRLSRRPVDVAKLDEQSVLVRSGVADGDLVVALGVHKLDAGQRVRVMTTAGL